MKYVDDYLGLYRDGKVLFNTERKQLVEYLNKSVLNDKTLHFDEEKAELCIKFIEKWFFPLQPFQKFLLSFVFLFHDDSRAYYRDFLWLMGRGAGKNGLISGLSAFLISQMHGVHAYNGTIVANSEDQAKTSVEEIKDVVDTHPGALQKEFYATNSLIRSRTTGSKLKFRTSNGNTKDGLRDGFVIFDEIHQYEDNKNVKVHISGLGKKQPPRVFYIGTDGYVREGFIDELKKRAQRTLSGDAAPDTIFPWICKIDNREQADSPELWEMANPMLSKPLSKYARGLLDEIHKDYDGLIENPSDTEEFMTKRMDYPSVSMESSVAPYEEVKATNQPIPDDIDGREAIGAVDFASTRDFVAAAVTLKYDDNKLITLEHQWATKWFCDKYYGYSRRDEGEARPNARIHVPIAKWEDAGLLTVVRETTLDPHLALNWMNEMASRFSITTIVMDNFRSTIFKQMFEDAGYSVDIIFNPRSMDGKLATIIDDGFPKHRFIWGDNPLLRWNTQNVLVKTDNFGNKHYEKKEAIRRKTDGFQAFEYTLFSLNKISDVDLSGELDMFAGLHYG